MPAVLLCYAGNYRDVTSRRNMRIRLRCILRSATDYHWSHWTIACVRVHRLSDLRVSDL